MKVEVLYVAECPSHPAAVKLVRDVLTSEGVAAEIRELLVTDEAMATELAFSGSPTIRINGWDVTEDSSRANAIGLPPVETVRRAVIEAREGNTC
jgi:protein-disulfide isomerase